MLENSPEIDFIYLATALVLRNLHFIFSQMHLFYIFIFLCLYNTHVFHEHCTKIQILTVVG